MSREILITAADTPVLVRPGADGEPSRVSFGEEPDGVTLVGDLSQLQRIIIEADRQIASLVLSSNGSPS